MFEICKIGSKITKAVLIEQDSKMAYMTTDSQYNIHIYEFNNPRVNDICDNSFDAIKTNKFEILSISAVTQDMTKDSKIMILYDSSKSKSKLKN